jgi:hypothetical protein
MVITCFGIRDLLETTVSTFCRMHLGDPLKWIIQAKRVCSELSMGIQYTVYTEKARKDRFA